MATTIRDGDPIPTGHCEVCGNPMYEEVGICFYCEYKAQEPETPTQED